ncbi:MAR-binding filament-like protein 1-1 isoform X1 [Ricinus communis]|uniref:MAR-binding filament-like protein 1-1 isoform X1 n=1 Tax=Ricinus communis TaxID=3988 RepID=UPI00201B30AE|nr:MAR-binding filament-like protein 1-1 isoform X1 [Ricinus communis]
MAMGSSHLLQPHFPSSSSSSSSFSSHSHSHSIFFYFKNIDTKRKKRPTILACSRQEDPDDIIFSRKRAVLFVGISVLPFLQLRARALDTSFTKEIELKSLEEKQKEELAIQRYKPPNPFLSLLNGLGIFGTGVLGAFYALTLKEKKAAETTMEYMTDKLKENEATIVSLEKNFEAKLLSKQEEFSKQLREAKEEQQVLVNQLNSANSTITGLGQELKNEKRIIEELNARIGGLGANLSKAEEDKKALEGEMEEKLNSIEVLQNKINLLSIELKDKEENVQSLSSLLAEKELEVKNLNSTYKETKDELAKAERDTKALKDELLKVIKELESKNLVVDELNSTVSSLMFEKDESNKKLNAVQKEYNDLKSSSEKKAALDAVLLREREDELGRLKEKLELAQNEVRGSQAIIADLIQAREDLRKKLDTELNNVKNLKHELQNSQEALGKFRNEASHLAKELEQSRSKCTVLEAEVSRIEAEFAKATETMQKGLENAKQSGEELAGEIMALKEQLRKSKEDLQIASLDLGALTIERNSAQEELVDVYKKVEVTANELIEEKKVASSLSKELENLQNQVMKDKEARKSLERDLEEATKSLDEMNRNALILSGELEIANTRIASLEDDKEALYKSLTEQKNASKEAQENMEDAHNMVLKLGKERESLEKKAKKLEEELASAKGEILRLRSKINSSKTVPNEQEHSQKGEAINSSTALPNEQASQKGEAEEKVTVTAKRGGRRRRTGSQQ